MSAKPVKRPAGLSEEDWRSVDSPELSDADFAAMGGLEVLPPAIRRAIGKRGPGKKPRKEVVKIRLDPDIIESFRAGGDGWQTRINDALREHVRSKRMRKAAAKQPPAHEKRKRA